MQKIIRSRYGGVVVFVGLFLLVSAATRLALGIQSHDTLTFAPVKLAGTLLCGLLYDLAAASYAAAPLAGYLLLAPRRWLASRGHRGLMWLLLAVTAYVLTFIAVAEWFFWEEFSARFNFIAVDYLVYTQEVIGNIRESYPMPAIFGGLAVVAGGIIFGVWRLGWMQTWLATGSTAPRRWAPGLALLALPVAFQLTLSNASVPGFKNTYNQELARNGAYSFCAAYWENSLSYDRFYRSEPDGVAFARLRELLREPDAHFVSNEPKDITRAITNAGPAHDWNVIQITVESLSGSYLGLYGGTNGLTPNLDRLIHEGVAFTNFYATGTRTVRGMEALTLCVPPTPGQSIVRRPNNENLFTLGSVFRTHGYDTAFIYSGFGYFDNMNSYFAGNGYRVIDRASVKKEDITYATVWGACDEDLYRWTEREADADYAAGKPFHFFVMTTSNHRPYGFPAGKIDLPPGKRPGAVKYTDFAIGEFLADARRHAWFSNTLFIIVADHCASAAGKTALPPAGYRIPALIWNPTLLEPRALGQLCSQIDLPPTLLDLMGWTYESRFFGRSVLDMAPADERAFIATYQKLGYLQGGKLAVLEPVKRAKVGPVTGVAASPFTPTDDAVMSAAIGNYQTASHLFAAGLNRAAGTPPPAVR